MKTIALLVRTPGGNPKPQVIDDFIEACLQQISAFAGENSIEILREDTPGDFEKATGGTYDFVLEADCRLKLGDKAIGVILENSAFISDQAILVGSIAGPDGTLVYGGRSKNGRLIQPDPVIPVPCRSYDRMLVLIPHPSAIKRQEKCSIVVAPGILATCPDEVLSPPCKEPLWRKIPFLRKVVDIFSE